MYFTSLPDHTKPGFDEQLHFSRFKKHNIVFNALSSYSHCDDHVGCLSFKTILSGEEWYGIGNRKVAIRPGQFLVLNDDQNYSCHIDTHESVRCLSVFFKKEFASSVFYDALHGTAISLDAPFNHDKNTLEFFQNLSHIDPELQSQLFGLISALESEGYNNTLMDERLVFLLRHLIQTHKAEAKHAGKVNALKASTQKEVYKRLCIAKDVLHSSYMDNPNLDMISSAACLSVSQLVMQFKAVFQITPHQYLTRLKLERAADLLRLTNKPVHEITWLCGFENVSAFCRAFKSAHGVQPLSLRKCA